MEARARFPGTRVKLPLLTTAPFIAAYLAVLSTA